MRIVDPDVPVLTPDVRIPDLAEYTFRKAIDDIDFEGVPVPGLRGEFHRRPVAGRLASVGVYLMAGVELFRAWGYVDETHCAHHAVRVADGRYDGPHPGCPQVRVLRCSPGGEVSGIAVVTQQRQYRFGPSSVPRHRVTTGWSA